MALITIILHQSSLQNVNGVGLPSKVYLETDIPSVIYYTVDNTTPTINSLVYVDGIVIPEGVFEFIIKAYATNGTDSSIISLYAFSAVNKYDYFAHGQTTQSASQSILDYFPFGNPNNAVDVEYRNNDVGTIYDPSILTSFANAFDADGNPACLTNEVFNESNYEVVFNTKDSSARNNYQGITKNSIFDFSNQNIEFEITQKSAPAISNDFNQNTNGDAHVLYQDCSKMDETSSIFYNSALFTNIDVFKSEYPSQVYGVGAYETQPPTMNFLRSEYIQSTNTINFYYFDSKNQKYIISSVPCIPKYAKPEELNDLSPTNAPGRNPFIPGGYLPNVIFKRHKLNG